MNQLPAEAVDLLFPDGVCQSCDAVVTKEMSTAASGIRTGGTIVRHEASCPEPDALVSLEMELVGSEKEKSVGRRLRRR